MTKKQEEFTNNELETQIEEGYRNLTKIAIIIGISLITYGIVNLYLVIVLNSLAASIVFTIGCIAIVLLASYLLRHFRITYYPKGRRI